MRKAGKRRRSGKEIYFCFYSGLQKEILGVCQWWADLASCRGWRRGGGGLASHHPCPQGPRTVTFGVGTQEASQARQGPNSCGTWPHPSGVLPGGGHFEKEIIRKAPQPRFWLMSGPLEDVGFGDFYLKGRLGKGFPSAKCSVPFLQGPAEVGPRDDGVSGAGIWAGRHRTRISPPHPGTGVLLQGPRGLCPAPWGSRPHLLTLGPRNQPARLL